MILRWIYTMLICSYFKDAYKTLDEYTHLHEYTRGFVATGQMP